MSEFTTLVYTPAGCADATLAICASRAGGVGVLNGELTPDVPALLAALDRLSTTARGPHGIKIDALDATLTAGILAHVAGGLRWLIIDAELVADAGSFLSEARDAGVTVLAEVKSADWDAADMAPKVDGVMIKGNEAGGFVGEDSSFILLQKWLQLTRLPLFIRGGVTPHVAAGCAAVGVAGVALDCQLLMMPEVRLPPSLRTLIGNLSGSETLAVGQGEMGEYFRLLVRPSLLAARQFVKDAEGLDYDGLRPLVTGRAAWQDPARALLPIGQDASFAAPWARRFGSVGEVLRAIDAAVRDHAAIARSHASIVEGSPLARAMGVRYPIIQGPMTRVSDTAEFAAAVAQGGAMPMVAFAVLKGKPLEDLLKRTTELLGKQPWGIGLLGFAPQELLDEQLAIASRFAPNYAIIAGGRPDQAVQLEQAGVPTFLHVPSANLIPIFLQEGARRFIFEGRECGGHIGPMSSFVLWSSMVDRLLAELVPCKVRGEDIEVVFAGGIHDAISCAMVQVITAPLAAAGLKIGILMGSAYLFTQEIVSSGSIVAQYQQEVLDCDRTVNLESGVGHASRCAYSPFARDFFRQRAKMARGGVPVEESRRLLDELILGRLRIASKGRKREGIDGALRALEPAQQREEGMYMLGQVAMLRDRVTDIESLHREVTVDAAALVERYQEQHGGSRTSPAAAPADIAIVGIASVLPGAKTTQDYWDNILAKVDAITEIPAHRWDWRMYFDADRDAKDKIYSKWGGFLDDLAFDPTQYGMPPVSIKAVDPMQLMGLEVAHRTLVDAGYHARPFDRERASVIIGASGGIGDVGMQYGLRSELPRFSGDLPTELAARLPEWTEDSFAGILPNVAAGRIANRLNFGGMNMTTDAACASSLAAVYQGVAELGAGRSDFVIAGGIDTVQGPFGYLCFSKTQALSARGRCSTFDAGGDGIVISEGIAMVALKRLADAERDGDRIYGVIKGIGASSDGKAKGMTAPLPAGQLRAMRRAYAMAGFAPSSVGLFEAHGTGTVAGDTAELESTTQLIAEQNAAPRQAVIGSVKTMIGHTKATAGAAGLVKAVLALHHRVLPPHSNVVKPNAVLADPKAPLYLLDEAMPWLSPDDQPRRAACSAFGFGGTNFHIVMEEYGAEYRDWMRPPASQVWSAELLMWSDADRAALLSRLEAFGRGIADINGLVMRDVAATLAAKWVPLHYTLTIVARNANDLRTKLAAATGYLRGEAKILPAGVAFGDASQVKGKVAVLFSGQGSQYPNMAREAALHFDPVRETLTEADGLLKEVFETRFGATALLSRFIFPRGDYDDAAKAGSRQRLGSTDIAQPALGAVEVGLLRLMRSLGLEADMFAGHSYGEFVALHAAGAIDFASLMHLSAARGRFIVDAANAAGAELGTMAAVTATRKRVESAIANVEGVVLANHNAPLQSVISGTHAAVKRVVAELRLVEVDVAEIPVAAAFHSILVKPAQRELAAMIDATSWSALHTPVYSNTTGRPHSADSVEVQKQMADHLVGPVEFVAEVEAMYADGARLFVEIGPKAVLARLVSRILDQRPHRAVSVDDGGGLAGLLGGIGQLLCAGVDLDIAQLFARRDCRIGDPAKPATLMRIETVSQHAWMLNGSGARRSAEPVLHVGVTLEQAALARSVPAVANAAPMTLATAAPSMPLAVPAAAASPAPARVHAAPSTQTRPRPRTDSQHSLTSWRKDRPMDDRRTTDNTVISEYFETMRQFLETQERVMGAFLGDGAGLRALPRVRQPMLPAMRESEPPPVIVPSRAQVAAPPVAAPKPVKPIAAVAAPAPAPMPAPAPAPVAAVTPVAAVAPVAAAAPVPAAAVKTNGSGLTREKMLDALLGIVEEKTGYPRDMLGLDQNLEADLGIDSIKRVEVVGAFLKWLPDAQREALTQSRSKLNTQSTLNGMLDLVAKAPAGATNVPFDLAGTGEKAVVSRPSRLVMRSVQEALLPSMGRSLTPGHMVLTRDAMGVADVLAVRLQAAGVAVSFVELDVLASEARILEFCQRLDPATPLAGIVHLAALGSVPVADADGPGEWRAALQANEKSLFLLLRESQGKLARGAHVAVASGLGGLFGREGSSSGALQVLGGAPGLLKSLLQEREDLRLKAIDLDPGRGATQLAADVFAELELDGGRQEVGYPAGRRTIFKTVEEPLPRDGARDAALANLVVLATGGARGITAEVLRELARPGNTLILTGRSTLPEQEPAATAGLADAQALRQYYVAQVRAGASKLTPGEIQRRVQADLGMREMRANLADFRASGAAVEYHDVDVTDQKALGRLIADIKDRHRRIDGVVHGAGVIEDKLLVDKQSASWSRVVETKLLGLLSLQKLVDPASLKFFTVFSSVAGRYGNSGQSDYATANELMNRICVALQARWGAAVAVSALCWGPWGPTKFGAGMVTADTEVKFAERGVSLVSAAEGRQLFRDELARPDGTPVEVICGQGPWESEETKRGVTRLVEPPAVSDLGPLLGGAAITTLPTGEKIVKVHIDAGRHLYVHDLDAGTPMLPATVALELVAEAARIIWPRWSVAEARELRSLAGIAIADDLELQVHLSPPPYGSSEGFDVSASIKTGSPGALRTHYQCVLGMERALTAGDASPRASHAERAPLPIYGERLARGPRLQVIESIHGQSSSGAGARVRGTSPADWLGANAGHGAWLFDPALLDAAAQIVTLWAQSYRGTPATLARVGRIVRHREGTPSHLHMEFTPLDSTAGVVRGNVVFSDEDGMPVLTIEDIEGVARAHAADPNRVSTAESLSA